MAEPDALRLTHGLRRLIELSIFVDAPDHELGRVADDVDALVERLSAFGMRDRWYDADTALGFLGYLDHSPFVGVRHPMSPPMHIDRFEGGVVGRAVFGRAYEGPPGSVHGGFVAAAFDEVLGAAQALTGRPGYTGTLTVRYERPTPLAVELEFRGWVDRVEGRKIFTKGECFAGETCTARADAVFLSVADVAEPGLG
jgi:acyl-coenzyme A thioesterase PaaI-like protein